MTAGLVARREIRERLRSKEFLVSTAVSLVLLSVVVAVAAATADDGGETFEVGVAGPAGRELGRALDQVAADLGGDTAPAVEVRRFDDAAAAEAAVQDGSVDAAVVGADEVVVDADIDDQLATLLAAARRQVALGPEADPPAALRVRALDPVDQEEQDRQALTLVGIFVLYGQLVGYGYWVAAAIVEDKSSRVIELLLAKTRPAALLTGKIVGVGVVGLLSLLGFVAFGLGAASVTGAVKLPSGTAFIAAQLTAWFLLGFALYSCVFAIGGALASRPEDLQSTAGPFSLVMVMSLFAALQAADDPAGALARVTTVIPTTAPLVMPIRQSHGELALWEAAAGISLTLAAIALLIPLTARIYTGAALFTRGPLKLRQALNPAGRGRTRG